MKRNLIYMIAFVPCLYGCMITNLNKQPKGFNIQPSTKSFVLIDAGMTYTPAIVLKKKRVGVIKEVKNQYLIMVTKQLEKQLHLTSITDTTLDPAERNRLSRKDSKIISALQEKYSSSIIYILRYCGGGFRKTGGKKFYNVKTAEYAGFFDTDWIIIQNNTVQEKTVMVSNYHSTKNSATLEFRGPGYKANKDDIIEMAERNAYDFAMLFKY